MSASSTTSKPLCPYAGRDSIFETVQHVEETVSGIDRRVAGKDLSVKGELRLTCTEVLANLYLAPHLSEFVRLHPDIHLSVVCTFQHLSLSRREADVAIRVTSNPPDSLVGRRLFQVAMGIYAGNNRAWFRRQSQCRRSRLDRLARRNV